MSAPRGEFSSKLGFLMAAAGSAVGLGNIWGFPTQVAGNGGAAFLLVYLVPSSVADPPMIARLSSVTGWLIASVLAETWVLVTV